MLIFNRLCWLYVWQFQIRCKYYYIKEVKANINMLNIEKNL